MVSHYILNLEQNPDSLSWPERHLHRLVLAPHLPASSCVVFPLPLYSTHTGLFSGPRTCQLLSCSSLHTRPGFSAHPLHGWLLLTLQS